MDYQTNFEEKNLANEKFINKYNKISSKSARKIYDILNSTKKSIPNKVNIINNSKNL